MYSRFHRILCSIISILLFSGDLHVCAESNGTFKAGRDNWSIANHAFYFRNNYIENLSPEHLKLLQHNLNHVEYRLIDPLLNNDEFMGECYGMVATMMLASYDILNPDEHAEEIGTDLADTLTDDLFSLQRGHYQYSLDQTFWEQSVITYYQLLQCTDAVRQLSIQQCKLSQQQKFQILTDTCSKQNPIGVTVQYQEDGIIYWHQMLACDAQKGSYIIDNNAYDTKIGIYEVALKRLETLYYNSESGMWTSSLPGINSANQGELLLLESDINTVNDKGLFTDANYLPVDVSEGWIDVVTSNDLTEPYSVQRSDGNKEQIYEYPMFYMDCDNQVSRNFVCEGKSSPYTVKTAKEQLLHSCVYYENSLLIADSSKGCKAVFDPSGQVGISGGNADYSLEMVQNQNYVTSWYDITVKGTSAEALLQMTPDGYLLIADDLHSTDFIARTCNERCAIRVNTQADAVLFTQTSSGELAAAVDADGDGFYETPIPSISLETLGDLDDSGEVDAADASAILVAAAGAGLTGEDGLTDTQHIAADVDGDGKISAVDASLVLCYAAETGLGTFSGVLKDFWDLQMEKETNSF